MFGNVFDCVYFPLNEQFGAFDADFSNRRRPASPGQDIINPFDLTIVKEKVDDTKYLSTLEYVSDIRWIRHNAEIVLKRKHFFYNIFNINSQDLQIALDALSFLPLL